MMPPELSKVPARFTLIGLKSRFKNSVGPTVWNPGRKGFPAVIGSGCNMFW